MKLYFYTSYLLAKGTDFFYHQEDMTGYLIIDIS